MATEKPELLRVEHLRQYFKSGHAVTKAVDDVSFSVKNGEIVGLVGESGCGKTTTASSVIKLYNITGGKVWFDGELISAGTWDEQEALRQAKAALKAAAPSEKAEARARLLEAKAKCREAEAQSKALRKKYPTVTQIQMIFQDPMASLNPRMTIKEIIAEGLRIRGMKDEKKISDMVMDVLGKVGLLPEHANRYPHEFSGGQRQRIGVARAIIMEPKMIIADEPVSALDVSIQAQVLNLFRSIQKEFNLTYIFISHDLSVIKHVSDRIAIMYLGTVVELCAAEKIYSNPLHPYTKALLSAIPPDSPFEVREQIKLEGDIPSPIGDMKGCPLAGRCPYATARCHEERPQLKEVDPGHQVACFLME